MQSQPVSKRATVHDVARHAGVSLATVDRVLNKRPGVRARTIERVEAAIAEIGFRRDITASLLARSEDIRLHFILPGGSNQFMIGLGEIVQRQASLAIAERMQISLTQIPPLDGDALAIALDALDPEMCDCAIIVATDTANARRAVADASARGIAVVTLVSDLPGANRRQFIGIDNRAAGRTAASLMGRFCGGKGKIGLVVGALSLVDHRERYEGFCDVISAEFPAMSVLGPVEGFDDGQKTGAGVSALLAAHEEITGIYSMGAGNTGLIAALQAVSPPNRPYTIVHELTEATRMALKSGMVDVVLDQNPEGEIRAAIAFARHITMHAEAEFSATPIEIGVFLRDNLR